MADFLWTAAARARGSLFETTLIRRLRRHVYRKGEKGQVGDLCSASS